MRVAYLTAGAAGMYCGSCLNDNMLARTLGRRGVDVALIPTYTPIRTDEENVSGERVFFGGINVYLQQKYAIFRKTPKFLDKLLDHPRILRLVSRLSGSTDARMLGEMTLAMLDGREGPLRKEVDKLITWLRDDFQPDLVHLTNAMFVGLASRIKDQLGVPVTCGLPGEDLFLDALIEPYRGQAMASLRRAARDIDTFTAPSAYYRDHMIPYLDVPPERITLISLGLDLDPRDRPEPAAYEPSKGPFAIGYLARRAPEKGLHHLVDAFITLSRRQPGRFRLKVAGYLGPQDKAYFDEQVAKIEAAGLVEAVTWVGELDGGAKPGFFADLHAFSMPAPYREPKGRSILEAMAHAVPVVQPDHGCFSQMVGETRGGLLFPPDQPEQLIAEIERLQADESLRLSLARSGRDGVRQRFTAEHMSEQILALWLGLTTGSGKGT